MTDGTRLSATPPPEEGAATPAALEARLRHAMALRAGHAPAGGADWSDLAGRISRATRRRQRLLGAAAGMALLVGGAGGFLGEAAATAGTSATPTLSTSPSTIAPRVPGGAATPSSGGPAVASPCMGVPGPASDGGTGSATHLFTRTTADGVTIRAYRLAQAFVMPCGVPTPVPLGGSGGSQGTTGTAVAPPATVAPGTVVPDTAPGTTAVPATTTTTAALEPAVVPAGGGSVSVELSDAAAVGQGGLSSSVCEVAPGVGADAGAPPASNGDAVPGTVEPRQVTTGAFGVVEGDPVWWVAVDVGGDVASVRMTFAGGTVDQMAPVDGVAVVAARVGAAASGGSGPYSVRGTLDLLDASGGVVATVTLPVKPTVVPVPVPAPASGNSGSGPATTGGATGSGSSAGSSSAGGSSVSGSPVTTSPPGTAPGSSGSALVCAPGQLSP
jgi:hypothetical protein